MGSRFPGHSRPHRHGRFFRHLLEEGDLVQLAATRASPRKKEEVPLWLYLASQITMRLHGQQACSSFPCIVSEPQKRSFTFGS